MRVCICKRPINLVPVFQCGLLVCKYRKMDNIHVTIAEDDGLVQGTNPRKVNCVHIETSSLWAEFLNKNRCISVSLVSEENKSI